MAGVDPAVTCAQVQYVSSPQMPLTPPQRHQIPRLDPSTQVLIHLPSTPAILSPFPGEGTCGE